MKQNKMTQNGKNPEMNKEEAVSKANKLADVMLEVSKDIGFCSFDYFKELAKTYGATKTMRRGTKYYAYFGNMYVIF